MIVLMFVLPPGCCGFNYRSTTGLGGLGMEENPATEQPRRARRAPRADPVAVAAFPAAVSCHLLMVRC